MSIVPEIDFSPLASLGQVYQQAKQRATREQVLGQLGQGDGPLDYGTAAKKLLASGDTEGGLSLAKLAQQQFLSSPQHAAEMARATGQVQQELTGPHTIQSDEPGPFGTADKRTMRWDAKAGQFVPLTSAAPDATGAPAAGGAVSASPWLAPGVGKMNSGLNGEDYLNQFSPEVKAAVKNYLEGNTMPTGNPRQQGLANIAKTIAQKYGPEVGIPADDATFAARRKMQTDLAASAPNSTGGIISNGKSAFEHLANLSDKMVDLGNYSSNMPFGGPAAAAANYIGNVIAPTSETKAKVGAFSDNSLKYGQEATKFYAGSGGGEAERMNALKTLDPTKTSSFEQAAYLQTEKELMLGRLRAKEAQIRDTLGQSYLDRHPVVTPDLSEVLNKIDTNMAKLRGQQPPPAVEYAPKPEAQRNTRPAVTRETVAAARSNQSATLAAAKDAIAKGADPAAVAQRLKQAGIDPAGLSQ